jgi:hypothetical protein
MRILVNGVEMPLVPIEAPAHLRTERALPSRLAMAKNAFSAVVAAVKNPSVVSVDEQARRLDICKGCEFFIQSNSRCAKCGCRLNWKTRLEAWHCPIDKW